MQQTELQFWNELVRLTKEYWVEVFLFFVFVTALFAVGIYIF